MKAIESVPVTGGGITSRARWLALAAIVVSSLVLGLDSTILVTALPTLSSQLGATTSQLQWISTAYLLALAGCLIPAGALGDRFGRRLMLLLALATFGVTSVAASQMTTAGGLILMRALMGISGAFVMPIAMAVLPTIFSERERPRAIAIGGAGMFLGLPLGPLVAGWLLTHYEWGSIFLINAPIVVLALLGVWLFIPESRDSTARRVDFVGAAFAITGVTSFVYGVIEQPSLGWSDPTVVTSMLAGAILLSGFTLWELRSRAPLIDLRLFLNPRFSWSILVSVVMSFALMGMLFVLTPFLQVVQGNNAQGTGVRLLPLIGGIVLGALGSDRLVARLGVRVMLALGLLICGAGLAVASLVGATSGYGLLLLALPLIGIGNAFAMFTSLNVILDVLPESQAGAGTALTRTLGQVGSSFGIAVMGSLLNSAYRAELASHVSGLPAQLKDVAEGSVAAAAAIAAHLPFSLGSPLVLAADYAYSSGMSEVLRVSATVMVVAALFVARFMPERAPVARQMRPVDAGAPAQVPVPAAVGEDVFIEVAL